MPLTLLMFYMTMLIVFSIAPECEVGAFSIIMLIIFSVAPEREVGAGPRDVGAVGDGGEAEGGGDIHEEHPGQIQAAHHGPAEPARGTVKRQGEQNHMY